MIGFIVAGLIIGALARLITPGRQRIGILWTLLLGLAGSVIGGTIANLLSTGGNLRARRARLHRRRDQLGRAARTRRWRGGLGRGSDRKRLDRPSTW